MRDAALWRSGLWLVNPRGRYDPAMSKRDEERAARLAQALRANLRRRKAQARGGALAQPAERDGHPGGHGEKPEDRE